MPSLDVTVTIVNPPNCNGNNPLAGATNGNHERSKQLNVFVNDFDAEQIEGERKPAGLRTEYHFV